MRPWNDKTGHSKYFIFMHVFINILMLKKKYVRQITEIV